METFNRLPWTAQKSVFQRLAEIADVSSMTKEERLKYDEGLRKYRDTLSVMEGARQKGRAEGRAEGLAEGRMNFARIMLQNGEPLEKIIQYTGLSEEEVGKL